MIWLIDLQKKAQYIYIVQEWPNTRNKKLIKIFMEEDSRVLFVKESHNSNSSEFKEFPVHCIEETSKAKIVKEYIRGGN